MVLLNNRTEAQLSEQRPLPQYTVSPEGAHYSCKASKSVRDCTRAELYNIALAVAAVYALEAMFACKLASVGTDCNKYAMEWLFRVQLASNPVLEL